MADLITLQFIVIGGNPSFVEIDPKKTVVDLKQAIHKEAIGDGQFPLALDLILWKVRRFHDTSLEYSHLCHSPRGTYFSNPKRTSIHVYLTQNLPRMPSILIP